MIAKLPGGPKTAARREHQREILGQSFVDPQQIGFERRLVIVRHETGGTAVLAVPGMNVLVRQQRRPEHPHVGIGKKALAGAVLARFVVLQPEVPGVIAQAQQKVVIAKVVRIEQRRGFGDQVAECLPVRCTHLQRGGAIGCDVDLMRRHLLMLQGHYFEIPARQHGRVDQGRKRGGCELNG